MTRWARGESSNKKKEHEPTSWNVLKGGSAERKKKNNTLKSKDGKSEIKADSDIVHKKIKSNDNKQDTSNESIEIKADSDILPEKIKSNDNTQDTSNECFEIISQNLTNVGNSSGLAADLEKLGSTKGMEEHSLQSKHKKSKTKKQKNKDEKVEKKKMLKTLMTETLTSLKKTEALNPDDEKELDELIHKDQRREKRRLKRQDIKTTGKTCFNCRKTGHTFADCPDAGEEGRASGICFKCGSTEHTINKCRVRLPEGHFPYAKCFICGEIGHMSKQCPDNPRGLYPQGGCCKTCSSVEHYNNDCPQLQQQQGIESYTLKRLSKTSHISADMEVFDEKEQKEIPRKKIKVVNF